MALTLCTNLTLMGGGGGVVVGGNMKANKAVALGQLRPAYKPTEGGSILEMYIW